jgi:NADH-quinone oxidoreductase subunit L
MFDALIKYPETLAHWIVLLPFLSFVVITLKLVINKNVRRASKALPGEFVEPKTVLPGNPLAAYYPVFGIIALALIVIFIRLGVATSLANFSSLFKGIVIAALAIFVLYPVNSRAFMQKVGPYIAVGAMAIAAIIATSLWLKLVLHGQLPPSGSNELWHAPFHYTWFKIGDWTMRIGVKLDGFAIFGVWMVTVVTTCIQWFSLGYMWDDDFGRKHRARFFAYMSLFATGMLGVVLSDNILTFLIGWEVMGLCSYLLIGFFTYKPSANAAQVKAFVTTRIGDVGFMLGIFLLGLMYVYTKNPLSFDFETIRSVVTGYNWWSDKVNLGWLPTAAALLIFMGAVGKSAQFPLHVWLPDAMEGPTPVSALIHAATMVAAGVFLVARFYWLFELSPTAMLTVAWIGAITAFGAATIGVVQYDIKRILAYSTISQLGYMMIGLGVGALSAGMFHLLTHAYFKALLFLGSGAVIYGCRHIQDIRYMGGLSKRMPITYLTFLVGTLALAGIFPLAGFWSKDEILVKAFEFAQNGVGKAGALGGVIPANPVNYLIFILAIGGAFLTAFYMFRLLSYVFLSGPHKDYHYRGAECPISEHSHACEADTLAYSEFPLPPGPFATHGDGGSDEAVEPREVPKSMWMPLVVLGVFAALYGFIGMPFFEDWNLIAKYLHHGVPEPVEVTALSLVLMIVSLVVVLAGAYFGYTINNTEQGIELKRKWKSAWPGLYRTVYNKYFIDEFYEEYIIQPVLFIAQVAKTFDNWVIDGIVNAAGWLVWMLAQLQGWWDNKVVDGIVNGFAWVVGYLSDTVKPIQSGYVQNYMMVIILFVLLYLLTMFVRMNTGVG